MTTDPRNKAPDGEPGRHREAEAPNRAAANLALLDHETQRLLATVDQLEAPDLDRETLCPGWSVAHVLTHLARNADALRNLVRWAVDGQERSPYTSEAARESDIDAGSVRPLPEVVADVLATSEAFRQEAEQLLGPAGEAMVRTRVGTPVTGAQVIAMRTLEVIFHHVDLSRGYTFADADPGWVARTLRRGARQWDGQETAAALTLIPDGMQPLDIGGGGRGGAGVVVSGPPADLLLWLARGQAGGLSSDGELPSPPPWA